MTTKPTKFPEWANADIVNPTSGQNNVIEPDAAHKLLGWDFNEKPPRNYDNYQKRLTNQWVNFFDERVVPAGYIHDFYMQVNTAIQLQVGGGVIKTTQDYAFAYKSATSLVDILDPTATLWNSTATGGIVAQGVAPLGTDTWIHIFVFSKATGGEVQLWADTDIGAANAWADTTRDPLYTQWRRIGSILIEGGGPYNIRPFIQRGGQVMWNDPSRHDAGIGVSVPVPVSNLVLVAVPPGVSTIAEIVVKMYGPVALNLFSGLATAPAPSYNIFEAGVGTMSSFSARQIVNTSNQIKWGGVGGPYPGTVDVFVAGYYDYRGMLS